MAEKLKEYRKKRDFTVTDEPSGESDDLDKAEDSGAEKSGRAADKGADKKGGKLKFAVQYHLATRAHYDFRLEYNGVLLSWAVPKGPSYNPKDKRLAVMVEDHPLDYADFEGTIPKGQYGGGTVMLWDEGSWLPQYDDVDEGLKSGSLKIELFGSRLKGKWALVRLAEQDGKNDNWLLIKENDSYALEGSGIDDYTVSIKTGRTTDEIAAGENLSGRTNPMKTAAPQLAKSADEIPEGDDWLYEIKFDGYRIIAFCEKGRVKLLSRNSKDFTDKFASVAATLKEFSRGRALVLDGEMVAADEKGRSDFQALQSYVKSGTKKPLSYVVFDLLALDGEDLRQLPLLERKRRLSELMTDAPKNLSLSKYSVGNGRRLFEAAADFGLEGIVGKRTDSVYSGERSGDWLKLKCYRRQEFVIGGYTVTDKKEEGVSALILGYYEGDKLIYVGRAGTGMTRRSALNLKEEFDGIITDKPPFENPPKIKKSEQTFWLKPRLVAEIQFAEITGDNLLRQASFKGLRADKEPREVVLERAETIEESRKETIGEYLERGGKNVEKAIKEVSSSEKTEKSATRSKTVKDDESGKNKKTDKKSKSALSAGIVKEPEKTAVKKSKEKAESEGGSQKGKEPSRQTAGNHKARTSKEKNALVQSAEDIKKEAEEKGVKQKPTVTLKDGEARVNGVRITSPDKIVYKTPKVTKLEVIEYYATAAKRMLPYVGGRILSVVRCHGGVGGECFFKKHPSTEGAVVSVMPVKNSEGETHEYFYIENETALLTQAQYGTLEFHVWGSRVETIEQPDLMVFDLDPDEGLGLKEVRQGVRDLKSVLDALNLKSFLKTSGGKGYHVVVPLIPDAPWDKFHDFAKNTAKLMESKWPNKYTSNIRKAARKGRIFIDWVRNGRGATSVAPYSLRARDGAKASVPISWEELDTIAPDGVDMFGAIQRLNQPDPWSDFFKSDQRLK